MSASPYPLRVVGNIDVIPDVPAEVICGTIVVEPPFVREQLEKHRKEVLARPLAERCRTCSRSNNWVACIALQSYCAEYQPKHKYEILTVRHQDSHKRKGENYACQGLSSSVCSSTTSTAGNMTYVPLLTLVLEA